MTGHKRLFLHSAPQDYDPGRDILFSPSCMIKSDLPFPEPWNFAFEPDPFNTPEAIHEAGVKTVDYCLTLLPRLAEHLNETNASDYSLDYWHIVLMNWFTGLIQLTFERQLRINALIEKYGQEEIHVTLAPQAVNWNFRDTGDYSSRGIMDVDYSYWLLSKLLYPVLPESWSYSFDTSFQTDRPTLAPRIETNWDEKMRRCYGVYGISPRLAGVFSWLLELKPPVKKKKGLSLAERIAQTDTEIEFNCDIWEVMMASLPTYFKKLPPLPAKLPIFKPGKLRMVGPSLYYDEGYKRFLGHSKEAGEELVITQHGGSYGYTDSMTASAEMEFNHYAFITWGWDQYREHKTPFIPLPAPLLSRQHIKKEPGESIVLVGTADTLLPIRIHSIPQPRQNLSRLKEKYDFIEELSLDSKSRLMLRPYPGNINTLQDKHRLLKRFPGLKVSEGPIDDALNKSALIVFDHPGTTFCQAIASNVPFLGFWDDAIWPNTEESQPCITALRDAGILFTTGKEAAVKVDAIINDIHKWWKDRSIQRALGGFRNNFAASHMLWLPQWLNATWKL